MVYDSLNAISVVSDFSIFGYLTLACFIADWDKCRRGKAKIPPFTGWQLIPGKPLRTSTVFWALFLIVFLINWTSWKFKFIMRSINLKLVKKKKILVKQNYCINTSYLSVEFIRRLCGLWRVDHHIHSDLST